MMNLRQVCGRFRHLTFSICILFLVLPGGDSIEQIRNNKNMVKVSLDQFLTEEDFNPISGYVSMAFYYKHKPTYSIHIHFKPIQSQHWSHFLQCSLISVNLAWLKWCLSCSALFVFILKPSTWPHRSIDRVRERPQSQHQPATSETHFHWVTESYRRNCNTFFFGCWLEQQAKHQGSNVRDSGSKVHQQWRSKVKYSEPERTENKPNSRTAL